MANEAGTSAQRGVNFLMRLLVSLILPVWGLAMLILGIRWSDGWWIAAGAVVLVIGIVLSAGSSLFNCFIPGGRKFG
jgi:hypothetical protein